MNFFDNGSLSFKSTPVIFGIISPPFSINTVSPILTSNRSISFALWSDALFTIEPPIWTGIKIATGVIAPVLPTW